MRILKAAVLVAAAVLAGAFTLPVYMDSRKVTAAATRLETISDAAARFARQTGAPCVDPTHLVNNPGAEGWRGPYLDSLRMLETPWGGRFIFDNARGLVGIDPENDNAPDKYRLGAEAELSAPIRDNPDWWPPYDPDDP